MPTNRYPSRVLALNRSKAAASRDITKSGRALSPGGSAPVAAGVLFFTTGAPLDAIQLSPVHDRQETGRRRGSDRRAISGFFGCPVPIGNDRKYRLLPSAMMPMRFSP